MNFLFSFSLVLFSVLGRTSSEEKPVDYKGAIDDDLMFAESKAEEFDFKKYHHLEEIKDLLTRLTSNYPDRVKMEDIGITYRNRTIFVMRLTSSNDFGTKPAILMESGVHGREWTSIQAMVYLINKLVTEYGSDETVTYLLDKYEVYVVPVLNPDGHWYSTRMDRDWMKNLSVSKRTKIVKGFHYCKGTDINRNFDIQHCGVGTSNDPCYDSFCGDEPFSEAEASALKDLMVNVGSRLKAYFSIQTSGQLFTTPYSVSKDLPKDYDQLYKVALAGANGMKRRYGTEFKVGSAANLRNLDMFTTYYEISGTSLDYAYERLGITMSFAVHLRGKGSHAYVLHPSDIIPACEEAFDGLTSAILAL